MNFIYFATTVCIRIRNCFSDKQYQAEHVGRVILVSRLNPEIVIHDYYFYVLLLLRDNLGFLSKNCFVFYECNTFSRLDIFLPILRLNLQIEHA